MTFEQAAIIHACETILYVRCCVCKKLIKTKPGRGQTGFSDTYCPEDLALELEKVA